MLATCGVDELNVHGDIVPLHSDALELRRCRRELYPGSNRHRSAVRSRRLMRKVNFYWRKPNRPSDAGDLLGTGRHLLVDAICVPTVRAHRQRIEHVFESLATNGHCASLRGNPKAPSGA